MRVRMLRYVRRAAVISSPLCILAVLALTIGCQQDPTIAAIDGLKSSSASERLQAVQVLAEASSARLTTEDRAKVEVALGEALSDADDQVRMKAVQGVMNWPKAIHQTKAATALGTLVVSDDAAFRRGGSICLGGYRTRSRRPPWRRRSLRTPVPGRRPRRRSRRVTQR